MEYKYLHGRGKLGEGLAVKAKPTAHREFVPFKTLQDIPPRVIALIPESMARENFLIPIEDQGERVIFAAADPDDIAIADKLRFLIARDVRLVAARREDVQRAIDRHYGMSETESVDSMISEFTETAIDVDDLFDESAPPFTEHRLGRLSTFGTRPGWLSRAVSQLGPHERRRRRLATEYGLDMTPRVGGNGMFFYVVEEGRRVLMRRPDGTMDVIAGPKKVWKGRRRFTDMPHHVAHPGEFLIVRYRDGRQEHFPGPAELWFDPRVHQDVTREDALQLSAREAVVVYSRPEEEAAPGAAAIGRRIVHGPALFVPQPGEWLHTFSWHGSRGGSRGVEKVANALVFQKLWLMPDQMYHDVHEVRTADDAVLTIKLMIFFELQSIERMLETTHDPIGDFINAATSDVVEFTGRHDFESFKQHTDRLNELETYRQLTSRAEQCGYRITKVVYRGYTAPESLQQMHNQAIEARTRLQLEKANEQQAQDLEDYRLDSQLARAAKRRGEQTAEVRHEIELNEQKEQAERQRREGRHESALAQRRREREQQMELTERADRQRRDHLAALRELGVNLTEYLTQGRADRVIELRGSTAAAGTHVHLDRLDRGEADYPNGQDG
jgi:hypothetical protein